MVPLMPLLLLFAALLQATMAMSPPEEPIEIAPNTFLIRATPMPGRGPDGNTTIIDAPDAQITAVGDIDGLVIRPADTDPETAPAAAPPATGPRPSGAIGFATLRGGSVIGEHSVLLAGEGELLTLSHSATDRSIFARGAVHAALWARERKPGFYSMLDVLGLN